MAVRTYILHDPLQRVIGRLNPNHTWSKSVYASWAIINYDENDAVLLDPKQGTDVGHCLQLLPESDLLPTWFGVRETGQLGREEKATAEKAAVHANTPTTSNLDSRGFEVSNIADNRSQGKYIIRYVLDIEGRKRYIFDPKDRLTMTYDYHIFGNLIHESRQEAGERWILNDVSGTQLFLWDSRDSRLRREYDAVRRVTELQGRSRSERGIPCFWREPTGCCCTESLT